MDCRKFHHNLDDYLQGGLDFAGRFGMERHAQQCFGCGKDVADAQKLGQMARELGRVKAPPNFEAAVLARIQERKATRRRYWMPWVYRWDWFSWRSAAVGISVAASVLLAVFLTPWTPFQNRPASPDSAAAGARESGGGGKGIDNPAFAVRPPEFRDAGSPLALSEPRLPALVGEDTPVPIDAEPGDGGFVEYMVPGPGDRPVIMRLPKSVRMRYGPPSEEYFMRNVSH